MLTDFISSRSLLQKGFLFMMVFFAFGFYVFGPNVVGYSLGYMVRKAFVILPVAIPRLIIIGLIWYLIAKRK